MSRSTYKNHHGGHEDLLTKDNYELWAPIIKRELEGADQWGYIDETRTAPEPLPVASPATDQLLFRTVLKEFRSEQSATGSYLFNACSKAVQERYLNKVNLGKPKEIWDILKAKLQGNDEESRSKLLTKFMTMTKGEEMTVEQYANKLKKIQELLNGDGANKFITDAMIIKQILSNAGPALDFLSNNLRTTPDLKLVEVLKRYDLAEESLEAQKKIPTDSVAALNAQSINRPQNLRRGYLPVCPTDWNGSDCWYHAPPPNHKAVDCGGLKELQRRHLAENNIDVKNAPQLRGYPAPGALPRPYYNNRALTQNQNATNQQPSQAQVASKRQLCVLCGDTGHTVDVCPQLNEAASALKRVKTAAVAEVGQGQVKEEPAKDQVPPL